MTSNWKVKKLGDVCEVIAGQSPEGKYYNKTGEGLPFYQGKKEFTDKYLGEPTTWTTKITKEAQKDDVLISVRAPVGPINFSTKKICIGRGLAAIRVSKQIDKEFLFNFLLNIQEELVGNNGAVFNSINKTQIENIKILLPPPPTQKQIVKILDEAFEKISKAKENSEQNLKNAKEVFESYLQSVFEKKGEGWEEKKIGEVCEVIAGQSPDGKYYNKLSEGLPFYQGKKEFTDKYIGEPTTWTTKVTKEAKANDVLMSVRAPVGPINFSTQKICIGRGLAAIRPNNQIDKEFLFNFLLKHEKEITGNTGAVFNSINKTQIENIKLPLPSITQQKEILIKVEEISKKSKKLSSIYTQKLSSLEELKQSILQKAFEGKLTGVSA